MIALSWNCRGLGNCDAVEVLTKLVRKQVPTILFLMETKLTAREMESIKVKLGFPSLLAVSCGSPRGGIALLWRTNVILDTQIYSPNHIDVRVHMQASPLWRLTGIYGHPEDQRKTEMWRLMRHLHARAILPWVFLGDFNEILAFDEKNGGVRKLMAPMLKFRHTLLHCGLVDLGFNGYRYTWRNDRGGEAFVEARLDKVAATIEWCEMFPRAKVSHLSVSYFDHDPILMDMAPPNQHRRWRHKIQQFEEKWVAHTECESVIRSLWTHQRPVGSPMYCLFEKIKRCRMDLIAWSKRTFGNTRNRLEVKQGELHALMEAGYGGNVERIHEVKREINELLHHEEVFWRQRSRSIWLPTGDKNTKFFHQRASQRRKKNNIGGLYDREGEWHTDEDKIATIAEEYYKQLFTSSNSLDMGEVIDSVDRVVTEDMAQDLIRPYTAN